MFKSIRQSLITRLMLYFFIAGLVLVALFGINIAFGLKVHFKNEILPNIAQYLNYIKDDIGVPPDLNKAQQLGQDLSIKIRIKGPDINWQSHQSMQDVHTLNFEVAPQPYQQFKIAHRHRHNFVLLQEGEYRYYFSVGKLAGSPSYARNMSLIVILVLFMLLLFYLIRQSLKPLTVISRGVNSISKGDLDSKISVHNSFEFEQLANGINTMANEIKTMFEAKQQLLLAISHELRSPLTRAQVNLALLPEGDIQRALKNDLIEMELLISQVLESQRLNQNHSALNKTTFQFDELIQDVVKRFFEASQIDLKLTPITLHADQTRMMLLIKNLIDNALKYSKQSSQVPIVRLFQSQNSIVCEIQDFGEGIKEQYLEQITQAFFRVDQARQRSTGGFGLGLYLSHLIVKAHHATMSFKSDVGMGTTVIVTMPMESLDSAQ